jgi:hypothetical protein
MQGDAISTGMNEFRGSDFLFFYQKLDNLVVMYVKPA